MRINELFLCETDFEWFEVDSAFAVETRLFKSDEISELYETVRQQKNQLLDKEAQLLSLLNDARFLVFLAKRFYWLLPSKSKRHLNQMIKNNGLSEK